MYINFKEGVKQVKDHAIAYLFFGAVAVAFLIPFILCSGVAKVIFGVLFSLVALFVLFSIVVFFMEDGSKKEIKAVEARIKKDVETFQLAKQEWITEFCRWYMAWQEFLYGNEEIDPEDAMMLGLNLHVCKTDGMSVFEKFQELFFAGVTVNDEDKYALMSLAHELNNSKKEFERDIIKSKIIGIAEKY